MATRVRSSKARQAESRPPKARGDGQNHPYGVPVPEGLQEAIETERDNLSKAESLLACMVVSMEYQNNPLDAPYYPSVAQLARELVAQSINGLDAFVLRQRLLRNKIEEVFAVSFVDHTHLFVAGEFNTSDHRIVA